MPEEVHVSGTGPNGEGFKVNLREKSVGLATKNLPFVLVILGAFLGGLVMAKILFLGQATGHELLREIVALLQTNNAKVTDGQHALREHIDAALLRQDTLVHQQTDAIDARMKALTQYVEVWFSEVGKRLEILDHNIKHPDRTLPLRGFQPGDERQQERGR